MKKLSLLLGTLGGGLAGYLFSNKKLRDELSKVKEPEEAARLLGKHLQQDGKKLGKEIKEFCESDEVQENFSKARSFAKGKVDEAKKELNTMIGTGKRKAQTTAKSVAKRGSSAAKKGMKKAKSTAKKSAKAASRKVKSQVRKIS